MTDEQFIKFYDDYADAIFRHCFYRIRDRELAKDLSQELFMRVWEYLARGKEVLNLKAFVYKVANNRIIDEVRKRKEIYSLDTLAEAGFDVNDGEQEAMLTAADAKIALSKLSELPEDYRQVFVLRHIDGLPIKEIAEILGETENNVSVRIHRALKKLQFLIMGKSNE